MIHALLLTLAAQGCSMPGPERGLGVTESAWSPDRRMHVVIVPEPTTNAGKAQYELRACEGAKESVLWKGERPFFLQHPVVTDSGWILGCADVGRTVGKPPAFHVCALEPAGTVRIDDEVRDPGECGNRMLNGALVSEHAGRILFRVLLPLPRGAESWRTYDSKTGAHSSTVRPDARQEEADQLSWIHGAHWLGNQDLVLVHWEKYGKTPPEIFEDATWRNVGSHFALIDSNGAPVWSVDVPSDLGAASYVKNLEIAERLKALDGAGILDATHDDRFEVGLIGSGMRVTYSLGRLDDGTWSVHETGRTKWTASPAANR